MTMDELGRHSVADNTEVFLAISEPISPSSSSSSSTDSSSTAILVNCPECGTAAMIEPTRRDAQDFCARCDFPLFWRKNQLLLMDAQDTGGASTRRLPGTVGRAAAASVSCPHCTEPNLPTATVCIRCGESMQILAPPPPPPPPLPKPVLVPEPIVEPVRERIWIWVLLAIATALLVGITAAVVLRRYFG
jgi:hypothetical protein